MNRCILAAALALAAVINPAALTAQQPTGTVGEYRPPRVWPQQAHAFDLVHQTIAISFDQAERLVTGEVTTTVVPTVATDTIRLDAEHLTIDAARMGGRPTGTAADDRRVPVRLSLAYDADDSHVTVHLPDPVEAGDTVVFTLAYHGHPERGIYFVPRKQVVWSQGEAVETRAWVPTYDAANDKATWDMLVTADPGMKVLSNGRLVGVEPAGDGRQVWHWSQEEPASTYLYSVVVGPFTVLEDSWRGIPVDNWVYGDTVDAGWRAAGETPSMIELYSRLLGVPYPWAKYDQSWIPDFTYGGMENVSATTQSDLALAGPGHEPSSARGLVAHELAHQWFGDLTTTANWANAWLNEGLTTYMASVQLEETRGRGAAQLEWRGQQQQAMGADRRQARPLVWGEYSGNDPIFLFFSGHVYPKGAQVAHQLRRLLGDSVFWAGMHRFLVDNAHRPVTTPDLAVAFERTCDCDLDWFFDQWVYGIGYPQLEVTRHWDAAARELVVRVDQVQPVDETRPLFRFPVTVRITTADSVVRREIMVSRETETFRVPLPGPPLRFRFDEGGWLLGTVHTDQSAAELAYMARHDLDTAARAWALDALAGSDDSVAVAARRFIVLNEHQPALRVTALRQMEHDATSEGRAVVRGALRDPDADVRSRALATLESLAPDGIAPVARAMYRTDPAVSARGAGLAIYARNAGPDALATLLEAAAPGRAMDIRTAGARGLARLHDPAAVDALAELTDPAEPRGLRQQALMGLVATGDTARAVEVAGRALDDYDPLLASAAARVLARLGTPAARSRLQAAARTEDRVTVKAAIEQALGSGR